MRAALLLILSLAVACGDDDEPVDEVEVETPAETPDEPDPNEGDPLAGLDDPEELEAAVPATTSALDENVDVPARGCAFADEGAIKIWQRPGVASIVTIGDGFAIAGYAKKEDGGEELFLLTQTPGRPATPILRADLEHPLQQARVAPPALAARDGGHVGLAFTDRRAQVRYARVDLSSRMGGFLEVGSGADQRYSPAVAFTDADDLVMWADGSGADRSRVRLSRVIGGSRLGEGRDLTPDAGGATCPAMAGEDLLFVDHREGLSTFYRVDLPDGAPTVLRATTHLFDPVAIAPVQVGQKWLVGYTAVGQAAQSAVGLVTVDGDRTPPPTAIVPSAGYGLLHVSATTLGEHVVFAADAPTERPPESPRRVDLRIATADGAMGEPIAITGPETGPAGASLASVASYEGTVGVVFRGADGVYLRLLRCDPGGATAE
ncbi:MAG: hypothetical protein JJ863_07385 [Deltaproteobacteria bacterium]|nr:hypothetical protein [Deltaproteobacteria bacterium]